MHAVDSLTASPVASSDPRVHRLQRTAGLAGVGFLVVNLPLTLIGVLADWQTPLDLPADAGSTADTFASHGTAISGPLAPVAITGALGLIAHRKDPWGIGATALLAVMAPLIGINGVRQVLADATSTPTPHGVVVAGGLLFTVLGLILGGTSLRALAARRSPLAALS